MTNIVDMTTKRRLQIMLERLEHGEPINEWVGWVAEKYDLENEEGVRLLVTDEAGLCRWVIACFEARAKEIEAGTAGYGVDHFIGAGELTDWSKSPLYKARDSQPG